MLKLFDYSKESKDKIIQILDDRADEDNEIIKIVSDILKDVKKRGDQALREYSKKFDATYIEDFEVTEYEIENAFKVVEEDFIASIKIAADNITKYHKEQKSVGYKIEDKDGIYMGQRVLPLDKVGIYVPGGTASYPSSVLMNAIPAKIAGVNEIIMVTPPSKDGSINPYIAVAAKIAQVDKIYKIGGAQAVGALAYGTETISAVDKIVGPGNIFVAMAKKIVFGKVDIDMIAGPSEILIIADEDANSKYIAADLISQAEHDKLASSILVTTSREKVDEVVRELEIQVNSLERDEIIIDSFKNYGMAIVCENLDDCIEISNEIAPEHLELMTKEPMSLLDKVKNAGSVFLGYYSPEPIGDYYAGTNHVLPTNRTARFSSPLSVDSFIKKSSYLYYSKEALLKNGENIILLAQKEGLTGHANSVKVRLEDERNN